MRTNNIIKSILGGLVVTPLAILPIVSCANNANYFKVTFDAGEGKITQGKTIVKVSKDTKTTFGSIVKPTVAADNKIFVGWTLNGNKFNDNEVVSSNITLKANYVSSTSGFYKTITFSAGTTGAIITGNNVVAVKNSHPFFTVNKPVATKDNAKFKWWSTTEDGSEFAETSVITNDVILYPVFTSQITISFGQPTGTVVTYHGPTSVVVDSGVAFSTIGRPDPIADGKTFSGEWYTTQDCSGTAVAETDTFSANTTLYPKMN